MMKMILGVMAIGVALSSTTFAQENERGSQPLNVPAVVKNANMKKYPESKKYHLTWETEKGNYEANWGGKDGEANSVTYTPSGSFVEIVKEIPLSQLPKSADRYIKEHFKNARLGDVGKVLDAGGKTSYEVEINGKDKIFDANGHFVKSE